uniref:Uncharacterized protein n=1 Tax=Craspedostauros australis TaxID=1486917 RepID=A0A7R9ZP42_9STRA
MCNGDEKQMCWAPQKQCAHGPVSPPHSKQQPTTRRKICRRRTLLSSNRLIQSSTTARVQPQYKQKHGLVPWSIVWVSRLPVVVCLYACAFVRLSGCVDAPTREAI